jgi:hypothetical protein
MGLLVSKAMNNDDQSPQSPAWKHPQRSSLGVCPSNLVFPKSSGPLIVDDADSNGTESSTPESSCYGRDDGQALPRYPRVEAMRPRRSWRDFSNATIYATASDSDYFVKEDKKHSHPDNIYIISPHQSRMESVPVKCPKPMDRYYDQMSLAAVNSETARVSHSLQDDDSEHLQTLYDLRTWALYSRITEARRKQTTHRIAHGSQSNQSINDDRNYDHQCQGTDTNALMDSGQEDSNHGHSFIFGELE